MKKVVTLVILACLLNSSVFANEMKKVFINQLVEHPALNKTTEGILAGLKEKGYQKGVNLDVRIESAQANSALASQISTKFVNQKPDIIVGVATLSAQSVAKYAKENKTKLIFSSVTDPIQAGLIKNINESHNNTSGVSNFVPLEPQLALFKTLDPKLKRLGFLYNPSEVNSLSLITELKKICPRFGITLVLQAAQKTAEVPQAATKLASAVDGIFISNDSTALSTLSTIIKVANKVKIPVYVSDTDALSLGALAALGPNQYQIGVQTANIIVRVLKGENINRIPVEFPKEMELYLNEKAAKQLGIVLPDALKKKAKQL